MACSFSLTQLINLAQSYLVRRLLSLAMVLLVYTWGVASKTNSGRSDRRNSCSFNKFKTFKWKNRRKSLSVSPAEPKKKSLDGQIFEIVWKLCVKFFEEVIQTRSRISVTHAADNHTMIQCCYHPSPEPPTYSSLHVKGPVQTKF